MQLAARSLCSRPAEEAEANGESGLVRLRKPYNFPVAGTHRPYIGAIEIAGMHLPEPAFAFRTFFPL